MEAEAAVAAAVDRVIASYSHDTDPTDQVLVQLSLTPVQVCGVLFTADLSLGLFLFCKCFCSAFLVT